MTSLRIKGADHEFTTLDGVKEDVLTVILNLKQVRFKLLTDEPQTVSCLIKGEHVVTAKDITVPGQVEISNLTQHIATLTDKNAELDFEATVEAGLGYVSKEVLQEGKVQVGAIALDAIFTPIRRVSCEVENMRVGNRTDFNRLRISIETDGTLTPREALERSIETMIHQLKAVIGFKEEVESPVSSNTLSEELSYELGEKKKELEPTADILKTRIEDLNLSVRTMKALNAASIRTVGGLVRKSESDLLNVDGLGTKGITEIKRVLGNFGLTLK